MINCSNVIKNIADLLFDPAIHLYELFPPDTVTQGQSYIYQDMSVLVGKTHILCLEKLKLEATYMCNTMQIIK